MKALRAFGILILGFCLWILLFPPWAAFEAALVQAPDSTSFHRLGHHWRFKQASRAVIDYRLMAYEIGIALVAFGLAILLLGSSSGWLRRLIVSIKVEITLLQTRLKNVRISPKQGLRGGKI